MNHYTCVVQFRPGSRVAKHAHSLLMDPNCVIINCLAFCGRFPSRFVSWKTGFAKVLSMVLPVWKTGNGKEKRRWTSKKWNIIFFIKFVFFFFTKSGFAVNPCLIISQRVWIFFAEKWAITKRSMEIGNVFKLELKYLNLLWSPNLEEFCILKYLTVSNNHFNCSLWCWSYYTKSSAVAVIVPTWIIC